MNALPRRCFTPEKYLLLENQAAYKSQYISGEICSMAGAEPGHTRRRGPARWQDHRRRHLDRPATQRSEHGRDAQRHWQQSQPALVQALYGGAITAGLDMTAQMLALNVGTPLSARREHRPVQTDDLRAAIG